MAKYRACTFWLDDGSYIVNSVYSGERDVCSQGQNVNNCRECHYYFTVSGYLLYFKLHTEHTVTVSPEWCGTSLLQYLTALGPGIPLHLSARTP